MLDSAERTGALDPDILRVLRVLAGVLQSRKT
jgi:hypothetical protein